MSTSGAGGVEEERRLFELLQEAACLDGEARRELLAASDPQLAEAVRRLLAADASGDGFLAAGDLDPHYAELLAEGPPIESGREIGPYRILEPIGAGGMGQVYLAEQAEPIQRQVALKVLHPSFVLPENRRRFAAERRIMGRLGHPNVGKILDAGTTGEGIPFLAMELIEGVPILRYCDRRSSTIEERLRLFVQVCRGVDHAHQKLLLHRDIKPSNILVVEVDGEPVPKLIDFGIAKILDSSMDTASPLTGPHPIGTPRYMSPEALGLGGDLDTRSDVFSLGMLLCELLTNRLPWQAEGNLATLLQRRANEEPTLPSNLLAGHDRAQLEAVSRARGEGAKELRRRLRGDLDAVVLKAVATDPEDRYPSAAELAADVERYLDHQPVSAQAPSTFYLLRKASRRHRVTWLAALTVLLALLGGLTLATLGWVRAQSEARAARAARAESDQVAGFLAGIFDASRLESGATTRPPAEMTALEVVGKGALRVEEDLAGQPRLQARLELTIGRLYRELGQYEAALGRFESGLDRLRDLTPPFPRLAASLHFAAAKTHLRLARPEAGDRHASQGMALLGDSRERQDLTLRAEGLSVLGRLRGSTGDLETAERQLIQALDLYSELGGPSTNDTASLHTSLVKLLGQQGRLAEAESHARRALEIFHQVLPAGHVRIAIASQNLAGIVAGQGRLQEAAPLFEAAYQEQRRLYGDSHPRIADSLANLGHLYLDLGQAGRAVDFHRKALAIRRQALGTEHPLTLESQEQLALALAAAGTDK